MRDRGATRALVLGLLSLPFGILSPFAIWSGARSFRRIRASEGAVRGMNSAAAGLVAGIISLVTSVAGVAYWLARS